MNLVSNDVRRFDDAMPFWAFLWVGPLELTCVLILLSIQLGAPAAFAGVATMLLVIPLQVCQLGLLLHCHRICNLQGWPPLPHRPGLLFLPRLFFSIQILACNPHVGIWRPVIV